MNPRHGSCDSNCLSLVTGKLAIVWVLEQSLKVISSNHDFAEFVSILGILEVSLSIKIIIMSKYSPQSGKGVALTLGSVWIAHATFSPYMTSPLASDDSET